MCHRAAGYGRGEVGADRGDKMQSTFEENTALVLGGALCLDGAATTLTLSQSSISGNRALPILREGAIQTMSRGGALYCSNCTVDTEDATMTGNGYNDVTAAFDVSSVECVGAGSGCLPCGPTTACQRCQSGSVIPRLCESGLDGATVTCHPLQGCLASKTRKDLVINTSFLNFPWCSVVVNGADLEIDTVSPAEVPMAGGALLHLTGYFGETAAELGAVQVAGAECINLLWINSTDAECTAPALTPEQHELTVSSPLATGLSHAVLLAIDSSAQATLHTLALSTGALSPEFQSGVFYYDATVTAASVQVLVTPSCPNASVSVNGESAATPVLLRGGSNVILVNVTSLDGTAGRQYVYVRATVPATASKANGTIIGLAAGLGSAVVVLGTVLGALLISRASRGRHQDSAQKDAAIEMHAVSQAVTTGNTSDPIAADPAAVLGVPVAATSSAIG
ncbi:hypothetical protein PAPYR_7945 [Paratrimastix pyriformis]|uniref:Uncharacterized protein n=1 Tax=Paratrimastix pyriformis TaxID=342808 RepID=A0ABQ8UBS1_9EUKA|nr:hypothetical protein PAPYR_7945 [Paratrimastix pyriformis]